MPPGAVPPKPLKGWRLDSSKLRTSIEGGRQSVRALTLLGPTPRLAYLHSWRLDFHNPGIIGVQQGFGVHDPLPTRFQPAHDDATSHSAADSSKDLHRGFVFPASPVPDG